MKSDLSDFTTKSTSKPGTPQVISTTNDTAQLKWTKPEQGSENIKSYIILFHQADTLHSETWRQYDTNTTNTIASVTGLQVKTQYVFKVCPACFSGTGSDSDKTEPCWTKATSPPGIPKASIVTHNTIQLKWSKPLHGSENVNHYVVSCHVQRGPSEDWSTEKELKTNGAKDFIPVSNLQPGKNYTFTVRSECAKSIEGMESDISTPVYTCQTSKPIASNITHNSVTLTWEKPAYRYRGDQVIKHYHVLCHSIPAQHQAKLTQSQTTITRSGIQHTAFMHFIMKGPEEHATVANLSIDTEYFFKIVPECTAPEVIGVDSEESERIRTKPASPPESVRASVVDHNHIKVRWSPPKFKIRNISNYRVSYQVQSHAPSTEWKTKDVSGNDNECTIGGLTGSTEYIFKVCVIYANRLQTGVESDVTKSIRTKASCKPGKIVYKDVSHDTIHLEWGQPKNFSSNVKYFVVSHSAQDHQQNVGTPVTYVTECLYHNITVKNLMLNTGYVFTVEPVCSSGFLGLSGSIPIETTQSTVIFTKATSKPGRPSIKDLSSVTHNSIELTWTPPKIGGQNVSTFCVLCRLNVEPMGKWTQHEFQTDGSQGYYNIKVDGLSPHTSYVFKVRPKCAAGQDGSESDLSSPILTKPTSPPHNLVFTEVTPKSLKLSWNRPECGSEKITKYAVAYWKAGNPNAHTKSLTTTEESASIIELEAKTKYIFKVIPECTYYGKSSASENSDPIETKPSCKPGIPVASTVTHNHVELKWPKPDFAGDSIQYYTVFYWPLNDSADIHDLKTDIRKESISIGNLFHNTQYKFSICPHCTDSEIGVENSTSDIVTTKATSKPGKPKASVVTHNSVELNWQKPEYGSELVKSYTVSYCNLKDSKVWKSQETNDQQENIVIRGLKLNETYVFKVKSECPCGDGSVSDISDPIVTRATSPPGKPTAIISHDSVILTWSPPEYGTQNVTTYIVSYRSTDESDAERKIRKSVQTNLKITSLKINTRYSFNVTTECKSGLGMESDSNDFMTKATSKPGTPQVILTTNDTAHLEWTKPEQGSENIKSYMILFTSLGVHSKTQQYNINTTNNTASVTGLEAKMQYVFKVCPVCFSGNGSDSDQSISHWTKATSPPGIPEATNVTHNTIQLKWSKPVQGSENVNHYVLSCRVQRGPSEDWNTEKEFKTNCAQEFVSVSNLQPGSSYTFTVRSQCAVLVKGMESASCQPIKTKLTSPPGKPIVINKQITCTTVSLEWTKPHVGNEYVKYYSVHYKLLDISQNQSGWLCSTQTSNNNTVVTVSQLAPESKYTFKVEPVCESGIGSESECSDVIVTKPSSEPGKPLVTFVTHNSVSLKWEKPKYGSEGIEYYTVLFHTANYPTSDKQTLKGTKECSIKVPNLSPCTKYVFMVRPEFKSGVIADCSDPSDPVETKATSQPGKLVADKVTHDSIQLKWAKPRIGASDIERYIIFYRISDAISEEWTHKHTDDVQGTILLDNLLLNMKYDIYVQPQCQTSTVGAESELVSIETKATSSPGKPTALSVYHNKIHLKWTKPDHGTQNISSYTLLYQSLGTDKQGLSQWIDSQLQSDESAIIESLNPGTRYVFKLLPRCKNGKGTESDTSDPIETKVTSKPGTPEAYIVDHNSLSLRWTKPEHGDDTIVGYVVHYKEDGPKSDRKLQECDVNDIVVGGLAPGKKYVFKIQPKCSKGLGATSDTSDPVETISTSPPGKPRVSAENGSITHDSITIHWTAPTNGTENVTGYTIHYHILKDDSPDCWKKCIVKTPTILSQTVNKLQEKTKYIFKVSSTCRIGIGAESICSEPIETTPLDSGLDINDHYSVYRFLKHMEDTHLRELGGALGLNYTKLTGMKDLRAETVAAWLRAEDDILARSGPPSWSSLVKALRNIGQTGIASKIERELNGMPLCSTSLGAEAETNEQRLLTSKPGKPEAYAIHHNSLSLCWTEPEHGGKSVIGYIVYYKEESSDADWKQQESEINDIVVGGLLSGKKYLFKIQPKCTEGVGAVSDTSDPVETKSTSPPGKPKISEGDGSITHDSISICWKAPRAAKNLIGYTIFYRRRDDSGEDWKIVSCDSSILSHTVKKLKSNTKYIFKVSSTCSTGIGTESEYSEPIETKRCCKPGKPKACNVSHDSIRLEWDNPQYGSVKHYNVQFKEVGIAYWSVESTNKNSIKLENLRPQSCYDIQVFPCCQESEIGIKCSELATIQTEKISLAERMKAKSHLLSRGKSGCLDTYQVPMWIVVEDELKMIRKCFVGEDTFQNRFHSGKVIMLVGATGTGKSTLINGLVNHVLGVKWEHSYRFKMIVENTQADQTKSQTKWITSYTIDLQAMEGSPIKYPLTIIDTPGFGDTEGIERDQIVIEQIRDFFCTPGDGGIDQIHAIGFATHAGLVRLTHLQKYIFDSIMSVFGNDVKDNILMMTTFADGQPPPVLQAVKEAGVPYHKAFKFNNSALFANNGATSAIDKMFWEMGKTGFIEFFDELTQTKPRSLTLTKEVLEEREHLEVCVEGLQQRMHAGLSKITTLHQEEQILKKYEAQLHLNEDFTYTIDVTKQRRVDIPVGKCVTNCLTCYHTCHYPCPIPKDEDKHSCAAMGDKRYTPEARCTICPGKCHWKQHANNPYRFETYQDHITKTSEDLKKRYHDAEAGKMQVENMIAELHQGLDAWYTEVLQTIRQTHQSLKRLQEIALKPNPLTEVGYIELLIESEKQEAKPGYLQRIQSLKKLRESIKVLKKLTSAQEQLNPIIAGSGTKPRESLISDF